MRLVEPINKLYEEASEDSENCGDGQEEIEEATTEELHDLRSTMKA